MSLSSTPVRTATPSRSADPSPLPRSNAQPPAEDVRAMKDALTAARERQRQPLGERGAAMLREGVGRGEAKALFGKDDAERFKLMKQERDAQMPEEGALGLAGAGGQGQAQAPMVVPHAPSPQTDPTAFAALIGQLWTREQAKGTREVSVRFGERAWPATGARLVRAADGSLDVALLVGGAAGGQVETALPDLRERLAERGVAVGALAVEKDG